MEPVAVLADDRIDAIGPTPAPRADTTGPIPRELVLLVAWTVGAAMLLSTQFLAQVFVWMNYPIAMIAVGWLGIFRNRTIVTLVIALVVYGAVRLPMRSSTMHAVAIALAFPVSAFAGEATLSWLGYESSAIGSTTMLLRVSRWCGVALAVGTIVLLHDRATGARAAAHDATLRALQIERRALESRLQMLRAQIEPHFLFNTLATIRRLHRSERVEGERMLANFIDYLRAALPRSRQHVTSLGDELELVRAYLGLVAVRMSGRCTWSVEAEPSVLDHPFPPLSLATLVENAIKHGIVPADRGGHVAIRARRHGDFIEAEVVDTGVGLSGQGSGSGIGLANTRARLATLHGPTAALDLAHNHPHGVRATIRIPR